jgi:hypothetical protein
MNSTVIKNLLFLIGLFFVLGAILTSLTSCGRAPSSLLRQGQLPVYDFPLYLSEQSNGIVWRYERDGSRVALATGLDNPLGLATDRFGNVYVALLGAAVATAGTGSLVKIDVSSGARTTIATGLNGPSVVGLDSFGEVFVVQDLDRNVIRARDRKVFASGYTGAPAFAFGVGDRMIVADSSPSANRVYWGPSLAAASATDALEPVNVGVDGMGRVYVAEGKTDGTARVLRYGQTSPGGAGEPVGEKLTGPRGIAVDAVGNIYIVEVGKLRIALATYDGQIFSWSSGLTDPQFLAFTQY